LDSFNELVDLLREILGLIIQDVSNPGTSGESGRDGLVRQLRERCVGGDRLREETTDLFLIDPLVSKHLPESVVLPRVPPDNVVVQQITDSPPGAHIDVVLRVMLDVPASPDP
jgi:hypothetical protein